MRNELELGVDGFDVPPVSDWGENVALTSVFRKFLRSGKVGHTVFA